MALRWEGMQELAAAIDAYGEQVRQEANLLCALAARTLATEVVSVYTQHRVTGTLASRVETSQAGPATHRVRTFASHAHLFESGSAGRRLHSSGAWRGRMPARPTLVPRAIAIRQGLVEDLRALVARQQEL